MKKPPKPENESYRLAVLRDMDILDTAAEERFDRITRLVCKALNVPIAAISLVDDERQWFKSIQGLDVSETSRDVSFCAHAIAKEEPLHINDTASDDRFSDNPLVVSEPNIQSYHGVPLNIDGAYVGALCGIDTKPHVLSNDQKQVLLDLGYLLERELVSIDLDYHRKLEEELNQSQEFQNLVFENIPDYLFVKNKQSEIVKANDLFLNLYPQEQRDKVIGYTTVESYPKEEAEAFLAQDRKAFESGESEVEETITFPDGLVRTLLTKKIAFSNNANEDFLLGLARDITELKAIQTELKEANSELEEFSYRTSHDLRSPLISSLAIAEMSQEALSKGKIAPAETGLEHIVTSIKRLLLLIDDLLILAQTKNQEEAQTEIILEHLVEEALEKFSHMPYFDRLTIKKNFMETGPICSKESRVKLIIENLISNSIKYQDLDEERPLIQIRIHEHKEKIIFEIEDNGLGIPEECHSKLFGMFNRFHSKTSYGSGLGLYMVKKSADLINANIEFHPLQKGSLFKLIIPG